MSVPVNPKYPLFLRDMRNNINELQEANIIEILHKELIDLRDNNKLIPGQQYRIIDYVATTSDPESRSANHPFDIIVTADDINILNENARAIQHEGDEYFKYCNLAAWKLKYCLDNDVNKFQWAVKDFNGYEIILYQENIILEGILISDKDNTLEGYNYHLVINYMGESLDIYTNTLNKDNTNSNEPIWCLVKIGENIGELGIVSIKYKVEEGGGKGIIYEMIDEHNNRAPYDFKGIQFKRYKYDKSHNGVNINYITSMITDEPITGQIIVPTDIYEWFYLYSSTMHIDIDVSLGTYSYWCPRDCYISNSYTLFGMTIVDNMKLPNIVVNGLDSHKKCALYIGCNCSNITINNYDEINVKIGDNCHELYLNSFSGEIKHSVKFAIINGSGETYIGGNQDHFTVNCDKMNEVILPSRLCRNTKWYNFKPWNGLNSSKPCYILDEDNYYSLGS